MTEEELNNSKGKGFYNIKNNKIVVLIQRYNVNSPTAKGDYVEILDINTGKHHLREEKVFLENYKLLPNDFKYSN